MQKLRNGDIVHVRGVAMDDHETVPAILFKGVDHYINIDVSDIVHVEPRALEMNPEICL